MNWRLFGKVKVDTDADKRKRDERQWLINSLY
jgi:hypothetical protein